MCASEQAHPAQRCQGCFRRGLFENIRWTRKRKQAQECINDFIIMAHFERDVFQQHFGNEKAFLFHNSLRLLFALCERLVVNGLAERKYLMAAKRNVEKQKLRKPQKCSIEIGIDPGHFIICRCAGAAAARLCTKQMLSSSIQIASIIHVRL